MNIQSPGGIPKRHPGFQSGKGHDMSRVIVSIFRSDIGNNLISSIIRNIRINIRHTDSLRIEKPLKKQISLDWINMSNAKTVTDKTSRG